jgi:HEAT repeat protein
MQWKAELYGTIRATIPPLIDLLKDQDRNVRSDTAYAFAELAEHGESGLAILATKLTQVQSGIS